MLHHRSQLLATLLLVGLLLAACGAAFAQQPEPQGSLPIIKTEKRIVLVDTVVTDKSGAVIRDLGVKNFRVWEDNQEQDISGVSFESESASPSNAQPRYLVLFFDVSTMAIGDQAQARQAAAKFIEANAVPNRLIAVVNYGGSLRIAQNFTADVDKLKRAVGGLKFSNVSPNASAVDVAAVGSPRLSSAESEFGSRSVLLAVRAMAKNLSGVPGRKTLVLLSGGFTLLPELRSELTVAIDACNRANVAIYPIDVRGLVAPGSSLLLRGGLPNLASSDFTGVPATLLFRAGAFFFQRPGGGAGGGSGGSSGGPAPSRPSNPSPPRSNPSPSPGGGRSTPINNAPIRSTPVNSPQLYRTNNPMNQPSRIIPTFPESTFTNQEVLQALASGTGGFLIANTNDLLGGLERIAREQNEYYIISYTPAESAEGSCHALRVKVDRGGSVVRARSGYCNVKPQDVLAGKSSEKDLENRVNAAAPGTVAASMQTPYFYTAPNLARVNIAMDVPGDAVSFEKKKGKYNSTLNILGIAYLPSGAVAARFSDSVSLHLENKKELEAFQEKPLHYENQFDVAPGKYKLKIAFSSSEDAFGKLESSLDIDPYDGKKFGISAVALSNEVHALSDTTSGLTEELIDGKVPLVADGVRFTPSGTSRFSKADPVVIYAEVYEPLLLGAASPIVAVQIRVLDRASGEQKAQTLLMRAAGAKPGNSVVPVGLKVPTESLAPGTYRVELNALDSSNFKTARTADFDLK